MKKALPLKEISVMVLALVIFFLLGEAFLRIYVKKHIIYDIEMSRYSMFIKADSPNPLIGHVHKPNKTAKLMGVDFITNSDGLRDREHDIRKKDGIYRIIFLGDSLTLGWGAEEKDTFKSILENELNKIRPTEIVNFGTGNYNTEQETNAFLDKGLKYNPDKVVVFYFINDAELTPAKSKLWYLGYSTLVTFYWSKTNAVISNFDPKKGFYTYYQNLYREDSPGFINAKKAFLQLRDVCRKNNIELQVVILPELHQINDYPFKKEHAAVSKFLKENDIDCLDIQPSFRDIIEPIKLWVSYDDAHPNREAHEMIARYSLDFIAKGRDNR